MTWTSKPRDYTEQAIDALRRAEEAIDGQPGPGQADELRTLVARVEEALRTLADTVDTAAS